MKYLIKILICTLFVLAGGTLVFSQKCRKPANAHANFAFEEVAIREKQPEKGWYEVKTKQISFFLPDYLKEKASNCHGGNCKVFENSEITILISTDAAAGYPSPYERVQPSHSEKLFCIDGRLAWFWTDSDNEGYKYHAGVYFYFEENPKRRLVIAINSKDKDIKQMAEKIIRSVEFVK